MVLLRNPSSQVDTAHWAAAADQCPALNTTSNNPAFNKKTNPTTHLDCIVL